MTTTTIYPTSDGYLTSADGTYSQNRAGTAPTIIADTAGTTFQCGVRSTLDCYEAFFSFDTSSLPANESVIAVVLSFWLVTDLSTTDFTVQARQRTWSAGGLTTADWVAGASLSSLTLLASLSTSGLSTGAYFSLTDSGSFAANINRSGATEIIVHSDRLLSGTGPSTEERITCSSVDNTGTSQDPQLVITSQVAPSLQTVVPSPMRW